MTATKYLYFLFFGLLLLNCKGTTQVKVQDVKLTEVKNENSKEPLIPHAPTGLKVSAYLIYKDSTTSTFDVLNDKTKALAIVSIFETSKPFGEYDACVVLNDGAGVSYGINQFTHRSGSLSMVIRRYLANGGQLGREIFQNACDNRAGSCRYCYAQASSSAYSRSPRSPRPWNRSSAGSCGDGRLRSPFRSVPRGTVRLTASAPHGGECYGRYRVSTFLRSGRERLDRPGAAEVALGYRRVPG